MAFLIAVMSFANFVFWPLVIGTIIAFVIEQILRQIGNAYDPVAVKKVDIATSVRKYFLDYSHYNYYYPSIVYLNEHERSIQ